ncbi:ABC transporter substrate-binding protein [Ruminococcus sp. AF31-8BH]|jgi:iron complex transport system substrate-binding protein|nr:ABC transporter substrate-binding protein [Ruminococcus sp. AF31-8BH]HCL10487.1 ABC transporter substrate-binding protein [Blautia sp.]
MNLQEEFSKMKKATLFAAATALLGAVWVSGATVFAETDAFPVTVMDDFGNEVTLEKAPESIVSLAPVDTEILFALGAGDSVTGRTDYCNYPEEAADVDSIGTYMEPNMELILSKSPDLVVASGFIDDNIRQQLEENGTAIFITNASDLESTEKNIETLGKLIGHDAEAEEVVKNMEDEWTDLSAELENVKEEKSAFIDIGSLYSAGPSSLLDNSMQMIKVENVAADADSAWPQLSAEAVVEANPDVYISLYSTLEDVQQTAGLSDLACLNEDGGFIYIDDSSVEGDMIQRPGPRYVEGLKVLAELVYPEIAE